MTAKNTTRTSGQKTASNTATRSATGTGDSVPAVPDAPDTSSLSEQPAVSAESSAPVTPVWHPGDVTDQMAHMLVSVLAAVLPASVAPCPRGGYDVRVLLSGEILTWHLPEPCRVLVTDPRVPAACAVEQLGDYTAHQLGKLIAELGAERDLDDTAPIISAGLYRVRRTADGGFSLAVIGAAQGTQRANLPGGLLRSALMIPGVRRMLAAFGQ